jgi:hypothetical protein
MNEEQVNALNNAADCTQSPVSPECCGTGCTVCVLDYPEYFSERDSAVDVLAMLESIEKAQQQAQRIIANQDGDSQ